MSAAYRELWNREVQAQIDRDIEKNRKADAVIRLKGAPGGSEVQIEQLSHRFIFGGNIFLFEDFKIPEQNKTYRETFGTLFNAATIPFYWKTLEPERGKPRFAEGSSYSYRRPPTDPVVAFLESRGVNMNGHAIIYGSRMWGHPEWMPEDRAEMEKLFKAHVKMLAARYKGRIRRWDVVNESIHQYERGLMPDDFAYKTLRWAMRYFPKSVRFNSNDCDFHWGPTPRYAEIVRDLTDRGIRIDNVGIQMHIFDPAEATRIANGENILSPEKNYAVLKVLDNAGRPIHISEVTISAPDETEKGQQIQALITRNLYRLWFSYPAVMGITWWNVADGGAAQGEPSLSGIYDKNVTPKLVYHTLQELIHKEWKTRLTARVDADGMLKFRGFRGKYRISWTNARGVKQQMEYQLD